MASPSVDSGLPLGLTGSGDVNTSVTMNLSAFTTTEAAFPQDSNGSIPFSPIAESPCQWILYSEVNDSRVRIWDLMILVPNACFLCFLVLRLKNNVGELKASGSPILTAFYGLVFVVSLISVLRCIVSMTVNASVEAGDIADKMLWLILRFFLLGTEASVIIFGIYFGHLDSRTSIRRVLICTSFFALVYSGIQGTLEMEDQHLTFSIKHPDNTTDNFDLFAHGGMIFLCTSSSLLCLVYCIVLILPLTRIRERFTLPSKRSFYYYVATLAILNLIQAVGSLLLYQNIDDALCVPIHPWFATAARLFCLEYRWRVTTKLVNIVIDVTTYIYFTCFDPLVYGTFLWKFFKTTQTGILFSYKHQVDYVQEDDQLSLPYQTPFAKQDGDAASSDGIGFGSTHFDRQVSHPHSSTTSSTTPPDTPPSSLYATVNSDYYQVSI